MLQATSRRAGLCLCVSGSKGVQLTRQLQCHPPGLSTRCFRDHTTAYRARNSKMRAADASGQGQQADDGSKDSSLSQHAAANLHKPRSTQAHPSFQTPDANSSYQSTTTHESGSEALGGLAVQAQADASVSVFGPGLRSSVVPWIPPQTDSRSDASEHIHSRKFRIGCSEYQNSQSCTPATAETSSPDLGMLDELCSGPAEAAERSSWSTVDSGVDFAPSRVEQGMRDVATDGTENSVAQHGLEHIVLRDAEESAHGAVNADGISAHDSMQTARVLMQQHLAAVLGQPLPRMPELHTGVQMGVGSSSSMYGSGSRGDTSSSTGTSSRPAEAPLLPQALSDSSSSSSSRVPGGLQRYSHALRTSGRHPLHAQPHRQRYPRSSLSQPISDGMSHDDSRLMPATAEGSLPQPAALLSQHGSGLLQSLDASPGSSTDATANRIGDIHSLSGEYSTHALRVPAVLHSREIKGQAGSRRVTERKSEGQAGAPDLQLNHADVVHEHAGAGAGAMHWPVTAPHPSYSAWLAQQPGRSGIKPHAELLCSTECSDGEDDSMMLWSSTAAPPGAAQRYQHTGLHNTKPEEAAYTASTGAFLSFIKPPLVEAVGDMAGPVWKVGGQALKAVAGVAMAVAGSLGLQEDDRILDSGANKPEAVDRNGSSNGVGGGKSIGFGSEGLAGMSMQGGSTPSEAAGLHPTQNTSSLSMKHPSNGSDQLTARTVMDADDTHALLARQLAYAHELQLTAAALERHLRMQPVATMAHLGSAIRVQHALLAASVHAWRPLELLAARTALLGLTLGMVKEAASGRSLLEQFMSEPASLLLPFVVITLACAVANQLRLRVRRRGLLTSPVMQLWLGRAAMLAFTWIVLQEYAHGGTALLTQLHDVLLPGVTTAASSASSGAAEGLLPVDEVLSTAAMHMHGGLIDERLLAQLHFLLY